MVGIVIVSHSRKLAEGIKELALQMTIGFEGVYCAAGLEDGEIGTDPVKIMETIREAEDGDGVVVLADIGSGVMSAEAAIEMLEDEPIRVKIADAPIVEGAIAATVEAFIGRSFELVLEAAEETRNFRKIS